MMKQMQQKTPIVLYGDFKIIYLGSSPKVLIKTIAKWDKHKFGYLTADFIIGYRRTAFNAGETFALHKRQEEVLRKFHHGHINLLIATSILEEGTDAPQCNVVIRFDRPLDYRAYIQSKNRARKEEGNCFVLVDKYDYDVALEDMRDFLEIEEILLEHFPAVHNPPQDASVCAMDVDHLIAPYVIPTTGAKVTASTAVAVVNRYCAKLPSDIFTRLVPHCTVIPVRVNGKTMYRAELLLPMNSLVKKVIRLSNPFPTKKLAQMAVAVEACRELYEHSELDDKLLPISKEGAPQSSLDENVEECSSNTSSKTGSIRRKRLYNKKVAGVLSAALPEADSYCYMYAMELALMEPATGSANPNNRRNFDPKESDYCFGFLSTKEIPPVPSFPIFMRQGRMQANILRIKSRVRMDCQLLKDLKAFVKYLFDEVLHVNKNGLTFIPERATTDILLVPLRKGRKDSNGGIDFKLDSAYIHDVVESIEKMPRMLDEKDRQQYRFDASEFKDAIVMPWYRDKEYRDFYHVAEIIGSSSPSSAFPDKRFIDFNGYFNKEYGVTIYNQEQLLLDVDSTSRRLNLLMPRRTTRLKRMISEIKIGETCVHGQILVPELVEIHPIVASLFNVIPALPTFLYRINSLLLANELRETIMKEAFDMDNGGLEGHLWPPLDYPTIPDAKDSNRINDTRSLQKENDENVPLHRVFDSDGDTVDDPMDFEIGVWDPELAKGLTDHSESFEEDRKGTECFEADTLGLMSSGDTLRQCGDMSDEETEDAIVLFDFMHTLHERYAKENENLFAPSDNIEAAGWDDVEASEEQSSTETNMPLSADIDQSVGIDSRALFDDLSMMGCKANSLPSASSAQANLVLELQPAGKEQPVLGNRPLAANCSNDNTMKGLVGNQHQESQLSRHKKLQSSRAAKANENATKTVQKFINTLRPRMEVLG